MLAAVLGNTTSPRQGFPINIDPLANCQGPDYVGAGPLAPRRLGQGCTAAMAYRHLNYKYLDGVANDTYYPIPASRRGPYADAPWSWLDIHTGGTRNSGNGNGRQLPAPAGALITALFDLEKDPTESNNLLITAAADPAVLAAVDLIRLKLQALTLAAVPPGNSTSDGRFQAVYTALGGAGPWCPHPTEAQCQTTATPSGPDADSHAPK